MILMLRQVFLFLFLFLILKDNSMFTKMLGSKMFGEEVSLF